MKGYGGSDVIEVIQNVSVPDPSGGKVLVTVKAAGVNPID
jgi:NADPH:quinone reductase-like Zn-dependent oxidoreductase